MQAALVQLDNCCKQYRSGTGSIRVLQNVALAVSVGEFVAVLGRSGSGKSTLLHILGLLDRPDSGRYFLQGQRADDLCEEERARIRNREIGFVFQHPALLPRVTALENVALPLVYAAVNGRERVRLAKDALATLGLAHRTSHWPQQLSGGEQQRVTIARALVTRPALLLADEPTGALDSVTSDDLLSLLEALNAAGQTIIIVTHDPLVARRAQRRITLDDGKLLERDCWSPRDPAPIVPDGSARQ